MEYYPIAIFWVLALIGLFGRPTTLIYLFFGTMPFGSFAVIPTNLTAGLTLTATPIIAALLIARTFMNSKSARFALSAGSSPRGLLLLILFWILAVLVTLLMPRLFEGVVQVTPMKMSTFMYKEYLHPSNQNFSQIAYLTISVFSVVAFASLMLDPKKQQVALKALCWGGGIAVFTGMLDMLAQYVPISPALEPFRTASYALMTEVLVAGNTHRVVGLMPEASSYGSLCVQLLALLYFTRHAVADNFYRKKALPVVGVLLLLFTWLSTSSSAYVGLVIFGVFVVVEWLWRAKGVRKGTKKARELELEAWLTFLVAAVFFVILLLQPHAFDPIVDMFDEMVLKKTKTASYEERTFWNTTSWDALQATFGLGVGMGGTRTSNALIAIFSNTGYAGALLYYVFVLQTLFRRSNPADGINNALSSGLRWAFLPVGVSDILAGTTADFGLRNAFLFGTAFAATLLSWRAGKPKSTVTETLPAQVIPEGAAPQEASVHL